MRWDEIANIAFDNVYAVAMIVIVGLGLSIAFGLMGVVNLAHGEFMMVGAVLTMVLSSHGLPLLLAMTGGAAGVALMGLVVERTLIQFLYGRVINTMLVTWGLSMILVQLASIFYGDSRRGISPPGGSFAIGEYRFLWYSAALIGLAVLLLLGTWLLLGRSSYGRLARAATTEPSMAAAVGVNVRRVNMATFTLASFLSGLAGAVVAPLVGVVPTMGQGYVASAFLTVVVGGSAVVTGFASSAAGLGSAQTITAHLGSPLLGLAVFYFGAIILLRFLPNGIAGRTGRDL